MTIITTLQNVCLHVDNKTNTGIQQKLHSVCLFLAKIATNIVHRKFFLGKTVAVATLLSNIVHGGKISPRITSQNESFNRSKTDS